MYYRLNSKHSFTIRKTSTSRALPTIINPLYNTINKVTFRLNNKILFRTICNSGTFKWSGLHNGRINLFRENQRPKILTWEHLMIRISIIMILNFKPHSITARIILRYLLRIRVELTLLKWEASTNRDSKAQTIYLNKHRIIHFRMITNTTVLFLQVNSLRSPFFIKIDQILHLTILIFS